MAKGEVRGEKMGEGGGFNDVINVLAPTLTNFLLVSTCNKL